MSTSWKLPTVQTSDAEVPDMPRSMLRVVLGFGLGTCVQVCAEDPAAAKISMETIHIKLDCVKFFMIVYLGIKQILTALPYQVL